MSALIELQYFPPIAYFAAIAHKPTVIVEKHEHYQKQTYRNRCYILGSQGRQTLIVPLTEKHGKVRIDEVKIDYRQKWINVHWRAIQSAYGKSPFFEYYGDDVHETLFARHETLYSLNRAVLTMCLKWLKWKMEVKESQSYQERPADNIIDLRSAITPKNHDRHTPFYQAAVYRQVFGNKFVKNLSLLDLIFCEGPGASAIVQASLPQ